MAILGQCACNYFETCVTKKKQIINISNGPKIHLNRNLKNISVGQLHRVGINLKKPQQDKEMQNLLGYINTLEARALWRPQ